MFPNTDTQFKSGESGNPHGRPKGSRNLSTILREVLDEEIEITLPNGQKEKKPFAEVIARKLIKKAVEGDIRAIREIWDRCEGKATQEILNFHEGMHIKITRQD